MSTPIPAHATNTSTAVCKFVTASAHAALLLGVCAWLAVCQPLLGQLPAPANTGGPDDYAPGEVLIKFRPEASDALLLDAWQHAGLALIRSIRFQDPNHPGITHASTRLSVPQALRILNNHPAIEYAEPNYRLYTTAIPNDPMFSNCWGLHNTGQRFRSGHPRGTADADIDAPEAWDLTTGNSQVLIAVIDRGTDISHPDLAANIWINPGEIPGDGEDNDGNGYVDDVNGWDFVYDDNTVFDSAQYDAHGTHVSGTIGAVGNNGVGIAGVNWQAKILPLKFIGPTGGYASDAALAVAYAKAKNAKVINASFGGHTFSQTLYEAIRDSGVLFVAAAGNDSSDNDGATPLYPASYDLPNVIAVAATDYNDQLASFSNYGATSVDLGAPGVSILSTWPNNQYAWSSGTSMAAPHVAGVAGLVYGRFPTLTPAEVKARILAAVDPIPALTGITLTGGRLDAFKALLEPPTDLLHSGNLDGSSANSGKNNWKATVVVTIHAGNEAPVQGATVSIQWSAGSIGSASATTDASGICTFTSGAISKQNVLNVTLTITSVTHATLTYSSAANHDDDPAPEQSDGTSITVNKP